LGATDKVGCPVGGQFWRTREKEARTGKCLPRERGLGKPVVVKTSIKERQDPNRTWRKKGVFGGDY